MKILCSITFHGYGHLSQAAPILNQLSLRFPRLRFVIQCAAPTALLRHWFDFDFEHDQAELDIGIPMRNALTADVDATYQYYRQQWQQHERWVQTASAVLERHRPDLVLANISHLLARAAAQLQIPCLQFCSLNWADILAAYCRDQPAAGEIIESLRQDYNQAQRFFCLTPGMPMTGLTNRQQIGPVCRLGTRRDLAQHLNQPADTRFVWLSLGGMAYPIDFERWQIPDKLFFIYGTDRANLPQGVISVTHTGLSHLDLIASCDLIMTKPGYGTFVEAACHGKPVLYLPRSNWAEEPYLLAWLRACGYCAAITDEQLQQGRFQANIEAALAAPVFAPVPPTGVNEMVNAISAYLPASNQ